MAPERQATQYADRIMLAFALHLILLLACAWLAVPTYSFLGICLLLARFLLPILLLLLPPMPIALPPIRPTTRGGWLDLLPAWAILLLLGSVIPGSDTLPDAPLPLLLLHLVVLTPILEELFFRGIPLSLCKHFDKRFVLLLLSLLFALLHSGFTKGYALLAGVVLGFGLLLGRGLLWSITLHALNNLSGALFLLLKQSHPTLFLPLYITFFGLVVCSGVIIAFLRYKRGCYTLSPPVYETEDGAPVPLARLATPISVFLLIVFAAVTVLL